MTVKLVEYESEAEAIDAARRSADDGYPPIDILSPVQMAIPQDIPSLRQDNAIGWVMVIAGICGALFGYGIQWYSAVIDFPINSGGRPLNSWPAFLIVPYEAAILFAAIIGLLGWMAMCGLPRLYHALFQYDAAARAVQEKFVLVFPGEENAET